VFRWEDRASCAYGESEITYLIPNQIAVNRMLTASVWAVMNMGMPIMVVNGDVVNGPVTNDPGQVLKVYGGSEDVARAVRYVDPPVFSAGLDRTIADLIDNTLTQSGANEVALGDSRADNATALATMRNAALLPLQLVKKRYYTYLEDIARIWADFWVTHYGRRSIKQEKDGICTYIPFDAERYRSLIITTRVEVIHTLSFNPKEQLETLLTLFEKGIITKTQLLERIPEGMVADVKKIISESKEVSEDDRI